MWGACLEVPISDPNPTRTWLTGIAAAAVTTVLLGVTMRWALAGAMPLPIEIARLRHAHSHVGYYGLLFPMAWLVWRAAGIPLPPRWALGGYIGFTGLAVVGFLRAGYAPEAIVGSTGVGTIWLWTAWSARSRMTRWDDPLGAISLGVVSSLSCVPFVARFVRSDPAVSQAWVATFLACLLFVVVVPSVLSALRVRTPWPLLLTCGLAGAASLGVVPGWGTSLGLAVYALLLLRGVAFQPTLPIHVRVVWALTVVGILGMATGLIPNGRPAVIGAIHFAVLSACVPPLAQFVGVNQRSAWWWPHHVAVALLSAPLVLQVFGAGPWTWTASAIGGSGVAAGLAGVLIRGVTK